MKDDVMISIRPKWCSEIISGRKTIEVRGSRPAQETPFRCFVYETMGRLDAPQPVEEEHAIRKGCGAVICEFTCDHIYKFSTSSSLKDCCEISDEDMVRMSGLSLKELADYEHSAEARDFVIYSIGLYGWHIADLNVYKKQRLLSDFCTGSSVFTLDEYGRLVYSAMTKAPRSWWYVAERYKPNILTAKEADKR